MGRENKIRTQTRAFFFFLVSFLARLFVSVADNGRVGGVVVGCFPKSLPAALESLCGDQQQRKKPRRERKTNETERQCQDCDSGTHVM